MATIKEYTKTKTVERKVYYKDTECDSCHNVFLRVESDDGKRTIFRIENNIPTETKSITWSYIQVAAEEINSFDLCPKCTDDIIDKYGLKKDK